MARLADQIRLRALAVGEPRAWTGLFDFLVFAVRGRCRVKVWFREEQVDVVTRLLPALSLTIPADAPVVQLVACRLSTDGAFPDEDVRHTNHWLGASELVGATPVGALTEGVRMEPFQLDGDDLQGVRDFYRPLGLVIHRTVAQGDCGVDACVLGIGGDRSAVGWQQWRTQLMQWMWDCAEEGEWQEAFVNACEDDPCGETEAVEEVSSAASEDAPPHMEDEADRDGEGAASDSSGTVDEGDPSLGLAECFGPLSANLAETMIATACPERLQEFQSDLELAKKVLQAATARASKPSYGQQVRATLDIRLALGTAFNRYKHSRASQDGGEGRCVVKDFVTTQLKVAWSPALKMRVLRAAKLATGKVSLWNGAKRRGPGGGLHLKRGHVRKNQFSTQGRPLKALPVREQLFQWFTDIRASIRGRLPSKVRWVFPLLTVCAQPCLGHTRRGGTLRHIQYPQNTRDTIHRGHDTMLCCMFSACVAFGVDTFTWLSRAVCLVGAGVSTAIVFVCCACGHMSM